MDTIVYTTQGKEKGKIELPPFFSSKVSPALLHEITTAYLANQRQGTAKTKTRGEVSFSGAKPWKQKGTGNARSGQRNSPLWRKGGVIFGPEPRSYFQKMSKTKKRLALNMALSLQMERGNIIVVDTVNLEEAKTKKVAEIFNNLKVSGKKVLIAAAANDNFKLASRNIKNAVVENALNLNAYQVLWADKIIISADAINSIKEKQTIQSNSNA